MYFFNGATLLLALIAYPTSYVIIALLNGRRTR